MERLEGNPFEIKKRGSQARNPDASRVVFYWPVTRPGKGGDGRGDDALASSLPLS